MALLKLFVLFFVICLAASAEMQDSPKPSFGLEPHKSSNISVQPPTTTSVQPPITTSIQPQTLKPKSTQPPTTKTPPSPTTTTTKAPTTSKAPPPITTTPTTTSKPSPTTVAPIPKMHTWALNYTNSNRTCVVLQMALQVDVEYIEDKNKINSLNFVVPPNVNISGNCTWENNTQYIGLEWSTGNNNDTKAAIIFTFAKSNTTKFELKAIHVHLNNSIPIKNVSTVSFVHNKSEFATPLQNSYKCDNEQKLKLELMSNIKRNINGTLIVSDVRFEAFRNETGIKFHDAVDCVGSETPDYVPIIVGLVLVVLIILVFVTYLIGRRRSQARGYLSM